MQNQQLREVQSKLESAHGRYFALFDLAPVSYLVFDRNHSVVQLNLAASELIGAERSKARECPFSLLLSENHRDLFHQHLNAVFTTNQRQSTSIRLRARDGAWRDMQLESQLMEGVRDEPPLCLTACLDLTERLRSEQELRSALTEKEVLLREIHHRVKNNLQIIISLLNLQARYLSDPRILRASEDIRDRIRAMALIHEQLYESANLSRPDFREYIRSLVARIMLSHTTAGGRVRVECMMEQYFFEVSTSLALGLVIHELVSNSLKHAFPGERRGHVRISLDSGPDNQLILTVSDDGIGLPESFSLNQSQTLGLRLVKILSEQVGGKLEWQNSDTTVFKLTFPVKSKPERTPP